MRPKKQVIWNQGQQPERRNKPRLPTYHPPLQIQDEALRDAWHNIVVGEMLVTTEHHHFETGSGYNVVPHPLLHPGTGYYSENQIPANSLMVYIGTTNVDCAGLNNRVIARPYATVFYNGGKYLINNQNHFKPVSL